jgi:pimeloyl-ACP methyl ester carboxylesterase
VPAGPPYQVGSAVVHLVDTSRPTVSHGRTISSSRALTTLVWYPEVAGRSPLVVFAHGFQVGPSPYVAMLEAWAAHGYVVAAPEFPLTDQDIAGPNLDENDINNQPDDLRFVTDSLVAGGSPVASRIDASRVAVAGHSDGSESALAASIAPTPAGEPAFRALVAMSVQELPGVNHTANPPMLVTQGDADTINPPSYGYTTYQDGSSPKFLLVIKGGGHLPPLQAGSGWLPGIESVTEAFLDAYVAADAPVGRIGAATAGSSLFALSSG